MTSDRIVFFGTDAFSVPALIQLLAGGWDVAAVVTKPDSRTGRGRELTPPAVKRLALAKKIPVLQPDDVESIIGDLRELRGTSGVVVAYGKIIPPSVLELFPKGLVNIHPSLLPKYRGATPIESAILAGDTETGVTLMQLDAGMDTGPTYVTEKLQLAGNETRPELYERLAVMGAELLEIKLPQILSGTIVSIPQDNATASNVGRISKADGIIDWSKPATMLERQVRAYLGWPGSRAELTDVKATITAAHVSPKSGHAGTAYKSESSELAVYAGEGSLVIDRLIPAGKREMTGLEFLAGHPL